MSSQIKTVSYDSDNAYVSLNKENTDNNKVSFYIDCSRLDSKDFKQANQELKKAQLHLSKSNLETKLKQISISRNSVNNIDSTSSDLAKTIKNVIKHEKFLGFIPYFK